MNDQGPTVPAPAPRNLNSALERNIDALKRRHDDEVRRAGKQQRTAVAITRFVGSFAFIYLHIAWIGLWIAVNVGLVPGLPRWDPQFFILGMVASVEAIFLSTFVLIAQNQMAAASDRRDALDLQISLLTEHELTKLMDVTAGIAAHLGIETTEEIEELKRDVAPEAVLDALEDAQL